MCNERKVYEQLAAIRGIAPDWGRLPTAAKDRWRAWCVWYDVGVIAKHPPLACRWFDINCQGA